MEIGKRTHFARKKRPDELSSIKRVKKIISLDNTNFEIYDDNAPTPQNSKTKYQKYQLFISFIFFFLGIFFLYYIFSFIYSQYVSISINLFYSIISIYVFFRFLHWGKYIYLLDIFILKNSR